MSVKMYICSKCEKRLANRHSLCRHKKNCHNPSIIQSPKHSVNSYSKIPRQHHHTDNIQDLYHKLNEADGTPLGFHHIGYKPPPTQEQASSEDESSSLIIDEKNNTSTGSDDPSMVDSDISDNESMVDSDDVSNSSDNISSTEDEEATNINQKVWRVILHWGDNNDCCSDVLDAFKYFCKFIQALDQDSTIEKIMDSVQTIRHRRE